MTTLRNIITRFGFKVEKGKLIFVQRGADLAKRKLRVATREARRFSRSLEQIGTAAKLGFAAFVTGRIIKSVTTDFANLAGEALNVSKGIGVTVEEYQELDFVAQSTGIQIRSLSGAMGKMNRKAFEAGQGGKEAADVFRHLGISYRDASGEIDKGLPLLLRVSEQFKKMPAGAKKSALLLKLFEETGLRFASAMDLGAEGIKNLMTQARKSGGILSKKQAQQAAALSGEMVKFHFILRAVRNQIALRLIPSITRAMRKFGEWARRGDNLKNALRLLTIAAKIAGAVLVVMISAKVVQSFQMLATAVMAGVRALRLFAGAGALVQAKFALAAIAIAVVALAIEDIIGFMTGKESLIGKIIGDPAKAEAVRRSILGIVDAFLGLWRQAAPILAAVAKEVVGLLKDLWPSIKALFKAFFGLIRALLPAFRIVFKLLRPMLKFFFQTFAGMLRGISDMVKRLTPIFQTVMAALTFAIEEITPVFEMLFSGIEIAINFISNAFEDLANVIMGVAMRSEEIWDAVTTAITESLENATETIANIWKGLVDIAETVSKKISGAWSSSANAMKRAWKAVFDWMRGIVKTITDPILTAFFALQAALGVGKGQLSVVSGALSAATRAGVAAPTPGIRTVAGTTSVKQAVSVGGISVTVEGGANLTPEQFQERTAAAVGQALNDAMLQSFRDFKAVTP